MKIKIPFLLGLLLWPTLLYSQASGFVSRVRADVVEGQIVISWKNSEEYPLARHEIWRSGREISPDNFTEAVRVFTQSAGLQEFRDRPPQAGTYYYLVLILDPQKGQIRQFIPFRNKTTEATEFDPDPASERPTRVTKNEYRIEADKVVFDLVSSNPERKIGIIRFAEKSPLDPPGTPLSEGTLVGILFEGETNFAEAPPPGIQFWYSFVDARLLSEEKEIALTEGNTTNLAVFIPLPEKPAIAAVDEPAVDEPAVAPPVVTAPPVVSEPVAAAVEAPALPAFSPELERALRALPLPRLNVTVDVETGTPLANGGQDLPLRRAISAETREILDQFLKTKLTLLRPVPSPLVLESEKLDSAQGIEKELSTLVKATFEKKQWVELEKGLRTLLKKELSKSVENRARFYLGQALTFQEKYRAATMEFLISRPGIYPESSSFLDSLLSMDL